MKESVLRTIGSLYITITGMIYIGVLTVKELYNWVLIREEAYSYILAACCCGIVVKAIKRKKTLIRNISILVFSLIVVCSVLLGGFQSLNNHKTFQIPSSKYDILTEDTSLFGTSITNFYMKEKLVFARYIGAISLEAAGGIIDNQETKLNWINEDILNIEYRQNTGKVIKFTINFNTEEFKYDLDVPKAPKYW
ncbi:MAG: hypothetical protein K0S30_1237 [Clostridia bacterium]|jgi:ABC-type transport system involved in multi-copper enzyme maturation permease subunit|nr:hypothetical protein [Clostridia bacterium]